MEGNNMTNSNKEGTEGAPSNEKGEGGTVTHLGVKDSEKRTKTNEDEKKEQERTRINKNLFLENWISSRGIVEVICQKLGLSKTQFYKWKKDDPEFVKRLKDIDVNAEDEGEDLLKWFAFAKKDPTMLRFWLRANHARYKLKITQEIIGGGTKSLKEMFDEFDKEIEENNATGKSTTENTSEQNPENKVGEIAVGVSNQKQTPTPSAFYPESGPVVLLEKENKEKSDSESEAKRNQQGDRRRPIARLHSERN